MQYQPEEKIYYLDVKFENLGTKNKSISFVQKILREFTMNWMK